jgi:hypothetical protein
MLSILLLSACSVAGCADPAARAATTPPPAITSLQTFPAALDLVPGESAQLQSQADDALGRPVGGAQFSFRSDDPALLTVDELGHVVARGPAGRTSVWVSSATARLQVPVRVRAGPPVELRLTSDEVLRVVAGEPAAGPVAVRLADAAGNAVSGAVLRFSVGAAPYAHEAATAEDGTASWVPELPPRAGAGTIRVETAAEPRLEISVDTLVEAAAVAQLLDAPGAESVPQPAPALVGSVRAVDAFGNPVTGVAVEWLPTRECGAVGPADAMTTANGLASVAVVARPGRSCRLRARVPDARLESTVTLGRALQQ